MYILVSRNLHLIVFFCVSNSTWSSKVNEECVVDAQMINHVMHYCGCQAVIVQLAICMILQGWFYSVVWNLHVHKYVISPISLCTMHANVRRHRSAVSILMCEWHVVELKTLILCVHFRFVFLHRHPPHLCIWCKCIRALQFVNHQADTHIHMRQKHIFPFR